MGFIQGMNMKKFWQLVASIAILLAGSCATLAPALDVKDGADGVKIITLDAKESAQCKDGGGCIIVSKETLTAILEHAKKTCGLRI
jgi:hypothetical protein